MTQLFVRRLDNKVTDVWIEACLNVDKNVHQVFRVLKSSDHSYQLEGMTGIWDHREFEIIPNIAVHEPVVEETSSAVINPNHYDMMGANTIEILAAAMTKKEWRGFCLGNTLKYRIRAGKKDDLKQDIDKANNYERLYEEHKHLCRKGKKKSKE